MEDGIIHTPTEKAAIAALDALIGENAATYDALVHSRAMHQQASAVECGAKGV